jgi:hypothetical protein
MFRRLPLVLLAATVMSATGFAQGTGSYTPPRTPDGQPDIQGVWTTGFVTMLERPEGVDDLVVDEARAQAVSAAILGKFPAVNDPQLDWDGVRELAKVQGEYRTSQIVDPADGKIPYTVAGLSVALRAMNRNATAFDNPEDRPLIERCLESLGAAPIRTLPIEYPRQIVQTRDHVAILSEDAVGLRIIHLEDLDRPAAMRSVNGFSTGRWEGDTLVVTTTHLRAIPPTRFGIGRLVVISPDTVITERFTRVSDTELVYRFTVEDAQMYRQPWTGEFSMTRSDGPIYEYACHEGNYSLPAELRGGQQPAS